MRNFARDDINEGERFRTRAWKKPEDQWPNDARRIAGVEVVSGSERNKYEPGNEWKVMANKPGKPGHGNLFTLDRIYKMFQDLQDTFLVILKNLVNPVNDSR